MKNLHLIICIACLTADIKAQSTDTWVQKADFGGGGRHAAAGFAIGNKGYIGTGVDSNYACTNGFWEYDPVSNIWTQKANYGGGIMCWAVSFSIGSKGYVGVGPASTAFWEYDPATNSWTQKANFGGAPRDGANGFSIDTKGYVGLGRLGTSFFNDFWEYNPATNSWIQKSNFPGMPRIYATGFSLNNLGYLGLGSNGTNFPDFYRYYPASDAWTQVASLPGTARYAAIGFCIGNKGYAGTGVIYGSSYLNDFWEFDPASFGSWIQKANFGGTARSFAAGFAIGNKGYLGTGTNYKADFWEYTPGPCSNPTATITAGGPTTFCSGGSVILSANTGLAVTYQWKKDGTNISGATNSNYSATSSGSYTVEVTNLCGTVLSSPLIITVDSFLYSSIFHCQWQNTIGGSNSDRLYSISKTPDGGYICGGNSSSNISGDKSENSSGSNDYWVVKLDASGNIQWQNTMGGNDEDDLYSISPTSDGGCICGGISNSDISGDKSENSLGSYDCWIIKLDASGNIQWQNTIGGSLLDQVRSISQTADGGYICGGSSSSNISGDKSENSLGNNDYWVLKLDASGNIQWQNTIGGSGFDYFYSVSQTADGGYICGGYSTSNISGDKSENSLGSTDYWVLKLDASGNIQWQNTIGGNSTDNLYSISQTADGGYICGGESLSNISGDKSENSSGSSDCWVLKLDVSGNIQWQNTIGGSGSENLYSISQTADGGYICGGYSSSNISGDKSENSFGSKDYWVLKLDVSGNIQWQNTIGGSDSDNLYSISQTADGGYICGGYSASNISGNKTENSMGADDYWVIKLSESPSGPINICSGSSYTLSAKTGAGYVYQWKKNGTNISGATGSIYPANSTGNYTVTITNSCGSSSSPTVNVTVNSLPSATITPAGPTTFCSGGSVVLNAPVAANRTYQWKKGSNLISGATLSSHTATTGGNYKVIVTNTATGCSKTTGSATVVTVNALPTATITPQGPTTFCAGGSVVLAANTGTGLTYKWKKGSSYISGATLSNYTATTGGNYRVQVTNNNGCSKTSALVAVSVPCKEGKSVNVEEGESVFDVNVYPNPNSGEFTIKFSTKPSSPVQIELTDEIGKVVKKFETDNETVAIKESNLAKGIYCLTARSNDEVVIKKINIVK